MKSERRHDLETNVLAVQLSDAIERVKPHLGQILGVVVTVAIVATLWSVWSRNSSVAEEQAWEEYMLASYSSDIELMDMKRLADSEEFQGTSVVEWAYLAWCDRQLALASDSYLRTRDAAMSRLETIEPIYSNLATGAIDPVLKNRAQYGLAQVYEMQGKIDEAQQTYKKVSGDLAILAAERAKQLEEADVEKAIDWLASAELPKPKLPDGLGTGGTRPSFDADIPMGTSSTEDIPLDKSLEEILSREGTDKDRYNEDETTTEETTEEKGDAPADSAEPAPEAESAETPDDDSAQTLE